MIKWVILFIFSILILLVGLYYYVEYAQEQVDERLRLRSSAQYALPMQRELLLKDISNSPPSWLIDAYKPVKFWVLYKQAQFGL